MNKILYIIEREYIARVKTKIFIITTLLAPLGFLLMIGLPIVAGMFVEKEHYSVHVSDPSGQILPYLKSDEEVTFIPEMKELAALKTEIRDKKNEGILILPQDISKESLNITFYSPENPSIRVSSTIKEKVQDIIHEKRLRDSGIDTIQLKNLDFDLSMETIKMTGEGDEKTNGFFAAGFGYMMGFAIYIFLIIYGMMVMRGVIEEKTSRVVELMISSVKPFQLMLGKVLGIAAVGLTQFAIWIILIAGLSLAVPFILGPSAAQSVQTMPSGPMAENASPEMAQKIMEGLSSFKLYLIPAFIYYFLGGFLLFGSLFAAVGSAADQESDAGQLQFPVMAPIIFSVFFISNIIQNPNGKLAVILSMIPFTSPVCMMVRMGASDVPWYEVALSMLILAGSFLGAVWVAGKIYRVGILMYGKKASLKEVFKWIWVK